MRTWGSRAGVIAALRDDAAAEMERLEREADAALARLRTATAPLITAPDPAPRLAVARRAAADAEAAEDWEDIVSASADRDAWIATVTDEGRRAVMNAPDLVAWTGSLAEEAVRALPGAAAVIAVPAGLLPRIDEQWRRSVEPRTQKTVTLEPGDFACGCVARTPDGKVTFDNRVEARERRTVSEWRPVLARLYEAAVADVAALAHA